MRQSLKASCYQRGLAHVAEVPPPFNNCYAPGKRYPFETLTAFVWLDILAGVGKTLLVAVASYIPRAKKRGSRCASLDTDTPLHSFTLLLTISEIGFGPAHVDN